MKAETLVKAVKTLNNPYVILAVSFAVALSSKKLITPLGDPLPKDPSPF